ncbi:MAG: DnaJ domain-containing protein [Longimicrobiaceae bacterium]
MPGPTHYDTLQVARAATGSEIRAAYRTLVRRYHPDLQQGSEAALRAVIEAYSILSDPERRGRYDRELAAGTAAAPRSTPQPTPGGDMPERARTMDVGIVPATQTFSQLGVLVLDGSGSMFGEAQGKITKAQAVNVAVREMLTRFRRSRHRRNFSFAVVAFDEQASVHTPATPAEQISDGADYDPTNQHGGGTDIAGGLREAQRIAEEFLRTAPEDISSSVVVVVMSDGMDGNPTGTLRLAEEIKRNPAITICTTYFAEVGDVDQGAQDHLRALATHPATGFQTIYDAETLRKFFIASVSTGTNLAIT